MVPDNFVRGLADKEIKTKVFALQEADCTVDNMLKVVEAEELGRSSVKDTKSLNDIQALSAYKKNQRSDQTPTEATTTPPKP